MHIENLCSILNHVKSSRSAFASSRPSSEPNRPHPSQCPGAIHSRATRRLGRLTRIVGGPVFRCRQHWQSLPREGFLPGDEWHINSSSDFFRLLHILLIMELWLVQVINHGISPSVTGGALMAARKFFELPTEEKMELASDDITRPVRYGSGPQRSFLKQYSHPIEKWMDLWPSKPAEFRCANFLPKLQIRWTMQNTVHQIWWLMFFLYRQA